MGYHGAPEPAFEIRFYAKFPKVGMNSGQIYLKAVPIVVNMSQNNKENFQQHKDSKKLHIKFFNHTDT